MHVEAQAVLAIGRGWIVVVTTTKGKIETVVRIDAKNWKHAKRIAEVINKP